MFIMAYNVCRTIAAARADVDAADPGACRA